MLDPPRLVSTHDNGGYVNSGSEEKAPSYDRRRLPEVMP